MEKLNDDELWQAARGHLDEGPQKQYRRLLRKNKSKILSEKETRVMSELRQKTDQIMLRKAYAFLLLKWRGHKLPSIDKLAGEM